jgi:UDP-GlcNAc:undecaprenyl-phosphate/decaprenyl-phosphate GlcNAc-1-phosphate transferase
MPSLSDTLVVGIGAFAVALVATPLAMRLATRVRLVDRPGPLKPQASATPYLGGVAIALGLVVGTVAYRPLLLIPLGMALAIGTADDVRPLPPVVRLAAELLTAVVLALIVTTRFTGIVSILLVVLATVVLVNGFNLIDGLDGLCGSVSLASAVGFAFVLGGHGRYLAVALAGAVAAFLVFNRPPARIYLGDGGSYLIGTATAALLALCWGPGEQLPTGIGALLLVLLPAAELVFAVIRRWRSRTSLLTGDRDHPYDQLVRQGWSKEGAVGAYAVAGVILTGLAIVASELKTVPAIVITGVSVLAFIAVGSKAGFMSSARRPNDTEQA